MTWALCLNCGEVKFGAICACPKCNVESTGDINLDIAFSDHRLAKETLRELGAVVAAINEVSSDRQLCFWTFIRYISLHHPSILGVDLKPEVQVECDALLSRAQLPPVSLRLSIQGAALQKAATPKRWWQFWKSASSDSEYPVRFNGGAAE